MKNQVGVEMEKDRDTGEVRSQRSRFVTPLHYVILVGGGGGAGILNDPHCCII